MSPQTLFLIAAFIIVALLLLRKKKDILPFLARPGWVHFTSPGNIYDVAVDTDNGLRVWFATDAGLVMYDKDTRSWRTWGAHNGLLASAVSSLAQSRDAVWLSTWRGVNRLDKSTGAVGTVPLPATILNKRIFKVAIHGGYLWAGTDGRGLYRYCPADSSVTRYTESEGLASNHVYTVAFARGRVWCGGINNLVSCMDTATGRWETVTPPFGNRATKIFQIVATDSLLWFASSNEGIWSYRPGTGTWRRFGKEQGFLSDHCYTLCTEGADLWAGTSLGLVRYDAASDTWLALVPPGERGTFRVAALAADRDYLWFGTLGKGIGKFFKKQLRWVFYSGGPTRDYISAVATDSTDVWLGFGYQEGWTDRVDRESFTVRRNYQFQPELNTAGVNDIRCSGNLVYFATLHGLYVLDKSRDTWQSLPLATGPGGGRASDVTSLAEDADGVWLGTDRGLYRYDRVAQAVRPAQPGKALLITALCRAGRSVYVGTVRGTIWEYRPDQAVWQERGTTDGAVITGMGFCDNAFWIGTRERGLLRIDPTAETAEWIRKPWGPFRGFKRGPVSDRITFVRTVEGRLWAGTPAGICVLEPGGTWRTVDETDGLMNNEVLAAAADEKYYWVGHDGGLTRIERSKFTDD